MGGLALVLGLLTRYAALILALDMIVAIAVAHLPKGFSLPEGYEFALTLLAGNLSLLLSGSGSYALDKVFGLER